MDEHLPAVAEPKPLEMIQKAIDSGIAPKDLKDLFDLQVRHEQRIAEERYAEAVTDFQRECPPIRKTKAGAKSAYKYASYEDIMAVIRPILQKHRIVLSFDTDTSQPGKIAVVCRVRVGTVEKPSTVVLSVGDGNRMMSAAQLDGATITFGKRYALCNALDIVCVGEDSDGWHQDHAASDADLDGVALLIKEIEGAGGSVNEARLLHWIGASALHLLTREQCVKASDMLRRKLDAARQAQAAGKAVASS